jgi:hypothetical protein
LIHSEWQQKRKGDKVVPFSGIKYDFQKLMVSNAERRLMIFKIKKLTDLEQLSDYFTMNIRHYKHLANGSRFLFIAFYTKTKSMFYLEINK